MDHPEGWNSSSEYVRYAYMHVKFCTLTLNSPHEIDVWLRGCTTPNSHKRRLDSIPRTSEPEIGDNWNERRLQNMGDWVSPIGKFSLIMNWTELMGKSIARSKKSNFSKRKHENTEVIVQLLWGNPQLLQLFMYSSMVVSWNVSIAV